MFADQDDKNESRLKALREKEAEDLAQLLAQKYGLPYLDLSRMTIELDALKLVPETKAREAKLVVFQKTGQKIQVAIQSPNPESTKMVIQELEGAGLKASLYIVSEISLERVWKRYSEVSEYAEASQGIVNISAQRIEQFMVEAKDIETLKSFFSTVNATQKDRKISEVLEMILAGAIVSDASDIHVEPQDEQVRLRFRMDGVLHDIFLFDYKIHKLLLSRIKLISGLKLNVHDQAQDGRFSMELKDTEIEMRVSVIPGNYGESLVLRILNPKSISVKLEDMGMREDFLKILLDQLEKPNGMILTTGPTGSGKTSTLYACLKKVYTPEMKIITLEDPVEYHLQGITQTQVEKEKDYTFANGLRAILRQDPDIIMVGEIRDLETASIAINAALTGHLVLSTLHTNNAAGTIPRMIDLGVNPSNIAPALNIAMAQRLVRKLCNKCKEKYEPGPEEKNKISKVLADFPKKHADKIPDINTLQLWKPVGCSACNKIGYKGRIGLFEAIIIREDENITKLIQKNPSETEVLEAAKQQEILTMQQDGILKVTEGVTTLDELQRVIDI